MIKTKIGGLYFPKGTTLTHIKELKALFAYDDERNFIIDAKDVGDMFTKNIEVHFTVVCRDYIISIEQNIIDVGGV